MNNKTIIVTGASGNMGQAVVRQFLMKGYHVVGTIAPHDPVPFEIKHPQLEKPVVDLTSEEASEQLVQRVVSKYGTIDAAVLTVGGFAMGDIAHTSTADVLHQYRLNFETAYNIVRPCFLQMMRQGWGRIFLVGSKPGLRAEDGNGMVAYGLAKSLIFRLAELLNEEARGCGVVTSVLVPGTIDTPQNRQSMPQADFSRWIKPETIASVISFYCSAPTSSIREPVIKLYD